MRTKCLSALLILIGIVATNTLVAQQPTGKAIYTLEPDEYIVYSESCINLTANANEIYLVTKQNDKFYVIDNGVKKGPFDELPEDMIRTCGNDYYSCAIFEGNNTNDEDLYNQTVTQTDEGFVALNVKGKTYGPYLGIMDIQFSHETKNFFAVAMDQQNRFLLFSSVTGKTTLLKGAPQNLKISPDGTFAIITTTINFNAEDFDASAYSYEELMQFHINTSTGESFGPYNLDKVTDRDIWFTKTSGSNWFMRAQGKLYLNGQPLMTFPEMASTCDLWFSPDGKRVAISSYEKIVFPDKSTIPSPVHIIPIVKNGKTTLKIITLENEKNLVLYSRDL